jgi:hypothetical protein
MPIDFPSSPSSGQRYDYLSKSWIWNSVYWASVGASGNISSGQLGTPVIFSGNIASGSIGSFHFASGVVGGGVVGSGGAIILTSGSVTSSYIGNNAIASGNIASGQVGRFQINDFNAGTNLALVRGGGKGYFAGGDTGADVSTADKLTYVTDTTIAQTTANLSQARQLLAGCSGEGTKGYFAGGSIVATADKLTYSTDTTVAQTSADLSQARSSLAGISEGTTKGYFTGGTTGAGISVITADKLSYSNDTTNAQTSANLSQARQNLAGCSGNSTKGYFAGGQNDGGSPLATADKLSYSNDTTNAQTSSNLSQARFGLAGISEGTTKGYFVGGSTGGFQVATADKITYLTDTTAAQTSANLSQARWALAGVSEGSTKGYFAGGNTDIGGTSYVATADKLTYSTDTTAAQTSANLSQARDALAGVGNEYGAFVFGNNSITSGNIASGQIGQIHIANQPFVLFSGNIASGNVGNNAVTSGNIASGQVGRFQIKDFNQENLAFTTVDASIKGYFAGGQTTATTSLATTDKLTYSNDTTVAQTTANLSQARKYLAGVSGIQKGYFAGGGTGNGVAVATADSLTYATDTTAAQFSVDLSQARYWLAGVSEGSTKGYFAGGTIATNGTSNLATTDKLTYSNDTTVAQTTANLSQARYFLAGVDGTSTKGYFAGGTTDGVSLLTTADKLTYSNDTTAAQTSANLSQARYGLAGCSGDSTKGYFAGGYSGSVSLLTTADKLTYSNDTTAAQTTANLSTTRWSLAGISQGSTKGYFAGGATALAVTSRTNLTDKITYATDTTAAQTSANLSAVKYNLAGISQEFTSVFGDNSIASGNIASGQIGQYHFSSGATNNATNPVASIVGVTKGYFAGGNNGSQVATADKLTYATDTTIAQGSANLSQARDQVAGCSGDSTKGYFAGGNTDAAGTSYVATADKSIYSTDSTAAQASADLSQARGYLAGVSEGTTKGYFAGGYTSAAVATANKLTYSTDTTVAQTSANLSQARYYLASVDGTSTKGYFAGGNTNSEVATADKLTYSTDTTVAQTTANLSQARDVLAGCSGDSTKGYFAGGGIGFNPGVATADKLTYSNDTTAAQTTANLSQARYFLAGVSERITKGYFAGGTTGSAVATADKLTYSTDTTSAQTTANLSQARNTLAGIGQGGTTSVNPILNSGVFGDSAVNSGNISSGQISTFHLSDQSISSGVIVSGIISRFKLSDQAIYSGAIASGQIPIFSLRSGLLISSSFGNGSVGSGQILASSAINSGGKIDSPHIGSGEINSFNIASGAVNASSRLGSQSVFNLEPASIAAGASLIFPASIWTTNLTFDSILSGGISSGIIGNTKISDQGVGSGAIASGQIFRFHTSSGFIINSGHFGDAALSSGSFNIRCVDGNSLTSGLWAVPYSQFVSGGIIAGYFDNNSINNNAFKYLGSYGNAGYFAGGVTTVAVATADELIYSTDTTVAQTSANLSQARGYLAGVSEGTTKGYFAGGYTTVAVATADKLTYVTATTIAQTSANLSQARYGVAGCSGDSTKGYFAGGVTNSEVATADKLTYSTDTTVAQTTANLSQARYFLAGVSERTTKGYFAGGYSSNIVATADKILYSTDTTIAQTSANLSQARYGVAGCSGDSTKGYFAGGYSDNLSATTDKLIYATDTTAAQTSANLSQVRYALSGVSELSTKGYFAGGAGISGVVTTADKITYTTDTTAAQTSANLSAANYLLAGVDGGISPIFTGREIVASGKLTTTAANKIIAANFADNSVVSGDIVSGVIFSVTGGYTPFLIRSVKSGAIPAGEIGQSHFARETLRSGNFLSGLLRLPDLLGDQIRSGTIGNRQLGQIHFAAPPAFLVTSSMVGSGSLDPNNNFAETAGLNTNQPMFDYFRAGELISGGIRAVCIASGSLIRRAECGSGLRLPAIGVVYSGILSGQTGIIYTFGNVRVPGLTLAQSSGLNNGISGFQGQPLYVGSGGRIVNQSGFWVGGVQQPPFLSGNMQQQIGIAISGGIFVMPSPRITRSGFRGTLPYDI